MNSPPRSTDQLPAVIPVFPLPGVLLLPGAQLPLNIFEPRYLAMTDAAIKSDRLIGMIQPFDAAVSLQGNPELRPVGCAGRITQFAETGDGRYLMTLTGVARFQITEELDTTTNYRQCKVDFDAFASDLVQSDGEEIDRIALLAILRQFTEARHIRIDWKDIEKATNTMLVNAMSMMGPFGPDERQALLEAHDVKARAETLTAMIEFELAKTAGTTDKLQ